MKTVRISRQEMAQRIARFSELKPLPIQNASADEIALSGNFIQGGLVTGTAPPGALVTFEGRAMRLTVDGIFLIGFGRDAGPRAELEIRLPDGRLEKRTLTVASRRYDIQRIDGLPERQVSPSPDDLARIRRDQVAVARTRHRDIGTVLEEPLELARNHLDALAGDQLVRPPVPAG